MVEVARDAGAAVRILITGATGLIGGQVVADLVGEGGYEVWALVRARTKEEAEARIRRRLAMTRCAASGRVVPLCGDITRAGCGLSETAISEIRESVELVVHCAAVTRFDDARGCQETNVGGLARLLAILEPSRRLARFFLVSSAAVQCAPSGSELGESMCYHGPTNGYIEAKRQAEQLLARSYIPWTIVRPSIVLSAETRSATFARAILWVVPTAHLLGILPVTGDERLDVVPVDFVGQSIARLVQHCRTLSHQVYHVSTGSIGATTVREVVSLWRMVNAERGMPTRLVPYGSVEEWRRRNERDRIARRLLAACEYYLPFVRADVVYDSSRLRAEVGNGMACPRPFTEYAVEMLKRVTVRDGVREAARP